MGPWVDSEAEAQLDPRPVRPGASQPYRGDPPRHLVRKEGDGAIVELDGTVAMRAGQPAAKSPR